MPRPHCTKRLTAPGLQIKKNLSKSKNKNKRPDSRECMCMGGRKYMDRVGMKGKEMKNVHVCPGRGTDSR